ncbi:transposase [Mesorhizobium sp. M0984]
MASRYAARSSCKSCPCRRAPTPVDRLPGASLGITPERIAPGKPQQNGRHERFHLTILPLAKAPEADRMAQGQAFEAFRHAYNEERPHEALAMDTPAQHYCPSNSFSERAWQMRAIQYIHRCHLPTLVVFENPVPA